MTFVDSLLFKKISGNQLRLLRQVIGVWFLVDLLSMLFSGYVNEAYVSPEFNFAFYGFEWIKPLPGIWMYVLFVLLSLLCLGIIFGYRLRVCLTLFLIGFGYVFFCDIVYTLNKFYLFLILAFVLLMVGDSSRDALIASWKVRIFQALVVLIYTYSGISKFNPDWLLHAEPLRFFLRPTFLFKWMSYEVFLYFAFAFTYGGILFDLSISWLLIGRETRMFGHIWQITFHLLNFILLGIGSLSIFMLILTLILFPPERIIKRFKFKQVSDNFIIAKSKKNSIALALAFFLFINMLIPLRHVISGNNVNWTEKGHRFSWRLMTRTKLRSKSTFYVSSDRLKTPKAINPQNHLTGRQYRKMSAETDLVLAFGHYLGRMYEKKGHENVKVTAEVLTRLNGRKPQFLIDPDLDLTNTSRSFLVDMVSTQLQERPD